VEDWLLCRFDCSSRGSVDCKHGREELVFPDGGLLFTAFDRIGYMGVLVLAGIASSVPYRRQQVTLGQTFFWILLVPIVVFVLLSLCTTWDLLIRQRHRAINLMPLHRFLLRQLLLAIVRSDQNHEA
jgi:hypothetical protein